MSDRPLTPRELLARRRAGPIIAGAILFAAFIGYFAEVRKPTPDTAGYSNPPEPAPAVHATAKSYAELRATSRGPSREMYLASAQLLRERLPQRNHASLAEPARRAEAIARRAERRAFEGAPPTIPHPVDQRRVPNCMVCHERGAVIGELVAPAISHPEYASCTQCHAPTNSTDQPRADADLELASNPAREVDNAFAGLASPGAGSRAYPGAPPTVPHGVWMRQNCDSCHGVAGHPGLRPNHLERQSCSQCHVPTSPPHPSFAAFITPVGR